MKYNVSVLLNAVNSLHTAASVNNILH